MDWTIVRDSTVYFQHAFGMVELVPCLFFLVKKIMLKITEQSIMHLSNSLDFQLKVGIKSLLDFLEWCGNVMIEIWDSSRSGLESVKEVLSQNQLTMREIVQSSYI